MAQFEFNEFGACTNPNKYGTDWRNKIETAQRQDGKWVFGISMQFDTPDMESRSFAASLTEKEAYETERDAAMAAIQHICNSANKRFPRGDPGRKSIDDCIEYVFDKFNQLTLF